MERKMNRTFTVLVSSLVVAGSLLAASATPAVSSEKQVNRTKATTNQRSAHGHHSSAQIPPIVLSGGSERGVHTQPFAVAGGFTVFTMRCTCNAYFALELDGDHAVGFGTILVNTVGAYSGTRAIGMAAGSYYLNVAADGPWSATITQPRNLPAVKAPHTFSGTGASVVGPFSISGDNIRLTAKNTVPHMGSVFVVYVYPAKARKVSSLDQVINDVNDFSGSAVAEETESGPYYLSIDSHGSWTVKVANP
jgi:hypothetical protein